MAIALFFVMLVVLVALPPLLATIFFDHVRSDPEPRTAILIPRRATGRRFTARTSRFGRRL